MSKKLFITDKELNLNFSSPAKNLSEYLDRFYNQQLKQWKLLSQNAAALEKVELKHFSINGFEVIAQYNPQRIKSTSANVDPAFIKTRKCFLCKDNLPKEQRGLLFENGFVALCNPYPIVPFHFTLPHLEHKDQEIKSSIGSMLNLSRFVKESYLVFYNGPQCGASAPDHLHFQILKLHSLPLIKNLLAEKYSYNRIVEHNNYKVEFYTHSPVKYFLVKSTNINDMLLIWENILERLKQKGEEEPLVNLVAYFHNNCYHLVGFPRSAHRPNQFFLQEEKKILISPASIDMSGLMVIPRKEDFFKLSEDLLENIYNQVSVNEDFLNGLADKLTTS